MSSAAAARARSTSAWAVCNARSYSPVGSRQFSAVSSTTVAGRSGSSGPASRSASARAGRASVLPTAQDEAPAEHGERVCPGERFAAVAEQVHGALGQLDGPARTPRGG